MNPNTSVKTTPAYLAQSVISFGVALMVVILGELKLPVDGWTRAFLGIGTLFLVSASFTLAKVIRDQHETENVVSRLDQARLERLLAEFDPYRVPGPLGSHTDLNAPAPLAPVTGFPPPPYANAG